MKRGEVMQLGPHRLMCGDAGDPDDVDALFASRTPDLIFTSVAAHQCGRIGYGMEISEEYCDIAVARIQKAMAEPMQEKCGKN